MSPLLAATGMIVAGLTGYWRERQSKAILEAGGQRMSPETFDWVKVRSECYADAVLNRLKLGVEADVDSMNKITREGCGGFGQPSKTFTVANTHGSRFAVIRRLAGSLSESSVRFSVQAGALLIEGEGLDAPITAYPRLNKEGHCALFVGEAGLELWQLRQLALERLFFS